MRLFKLIIFSFFALTLVSCASHKRCNYYDVHLVTEKLVKSGVKVTDADDRVEIVIPAKIFNEGSANFSKFSYPVLFDLAYLMHFYDKSVVSFSSVDSLIGKARAQKIMNYLWSNGIDANFAYTKTSAVNVVNDVVIIGFKKL